MSTKDSRITANPPPATPESARPEEKEQESMPATTADPIDNAAHLWALRLWIVAALVIVGFAICNYLLNWFVK